MSDEDPKDELERLRKENEALKALKKGASSGIIRMKVSEKGAVSIYGMGRFPVTLYKDVTLTEFPDAHHAFDNPVFKRVHNRHLKHRPRAAVRCRKSQRVRSSMP